MRRIMQLARATVWWLGLAALGCLVLLLVLVAAAPKLLGWQFVVVAGGSMEPTIALGSVAVMEPLNGFDARPGDIIMFNDPSTGQVVTHRAVGHAEDGVSLVTQGDANAVPDVAAVPPGSVTARYLYHVPQVGRAIHRMHSPAGYLSLVAVPGALIILFELVSIVRVLRRRHQRAVAAVQKSEELRVRGRVLARPPA